jgi:hypothetical protein
MSSGGLIGTLFVVVTFVLLGLEWLSRRSGAARAQDAGPQPAQPVRRSPDGR